LTRSIATCIGIIVGSRNLRFESVRHLILYDFRDPLVRFCAHDHGRSDPAANLCLDGQVGDADNRAGAFGPNDHRIRIDAGDADFRRVHPIRSSRPDIGCRQCRSNSQHGPSNHFQRLEMTTSEGLARPRLKGLWFPDGFHGTMARVCFPRLPRIASRRTALRNNLASLSLCYAAVASAERGEAVKPGSVRRLHSVNDA